MIFWSHNSDWAKARRASLPAHSAVSVHRVRRRCCRFCSLPPSPKRSALPKHRLRPLTHTCLVTLKGGLRGVLNHLLPASPQGGAGGKRGAVGWHDGLGRDSDGGPPALPSAPAALPAPCTSGVRCQLGGYYPNQPKCFGKLHCSMLLARDSYADVRFRLTFSRLWGRVPIRTFPHSLAPGAALHSLSVYSPVSVSVLLRQ